MGNVAMGDRTSKARIGDQVALPPRQTRALTYQVAHTLPPIPNVGTQLKEAPNRGALTVVPFHAYSSSKEGFD